MIFIHLRSMYRKISMFFILTMDIPSKSVQVLPYHHVVSVLYHRHIQKESYNKDTILPLSDFYAIIPTGSVTPSANIFPQNKIKSFKVKDPLFSRNTLLRCVIKYCSFG